MAKSVWKSIYWENQTSRQAEPSWSKLPLSFVFLGLLLLYMLMSTVTCETGAIVHPCIFLSLEWILNTNLLVPIFCLWQLQCGKVYSLTQTLLSVTTVRFLALAESDVPLVVGSFLNLLINFVGLPLSDLKHEIYPIWHFWGRKCALEACN